MTTTTTAAPEVTRYRLRFPRHSRWATQVTFADGRTVKFDELLSKSAAIRNATCQIENHPELYAN